jgi:hypothetical protein
MPLFGQAHQVVVAAGGRRGVDELDDGGQCMHRVMAKRHIDSCRG